MSNPEENKDLLTTPIKEEKKTPPNSERKDGDSDDKKSNTSESKISENVDNNKNINVESNVDNLTTRTDGSNATCFQSLFRDSESEEVKNKLDNFSKQNSNIKLTEDNFSKQNSNKKLTEDNFSKQNSEKKSPENRDNANEYKKIKEDDDEVPDLLNETIDNVLLGSDPDKNNELAAIENELAKEGEQLVSLVKEINKHLAEYHEIKSDEVDRVISDMNGQKDEVNKVISELNKEIADGTKTINIESSGLVAVVPHIGFIPQDDKQLGFFSLRYWIKTERSDKVRKSDAQKRFNELKQKFDQQISDMRELAEKEEEDLEHIKLYSDKVNGEDHKNGKGTDLTLNLGNLENQIKNNNSGFNTVRSQDSKKGDGMDKITEEQEQNNANNTYGKIIIDGIKGVYNKASSYLPKFAVAKKTNTLEATNEKKEVQEEYAKQQANTKSTNAEEFTDVNANNNLYENPNVTDNQELDTATAYYGPDFGEMIQYVGCVLALYMIHLINQGMNDTTYNSHFDL